MNSIKWMISFAIGIFIVIFPSAVAGFFTSGGNIPNEIFPYIAPSNIVIEMSFCLVYLFSIYIIASKIMSGDRVKTPLLFLIKGIAYAAFTAVFFSVYATTLTIILAICILIFDIYIFFNLIDNDSYAYLLFLPELVWMSFLTALLLIIYKSI